MDGSEQPGAQGLCPTGWHVPTDEAWKELEMELGMTQAEADDDGWRGTPVGDQMKDVDEGWCNNTSLPPCGTSGF